MNKKQLAQNICLIKQIIEPQILKQAVQVIRAQINSFKSQKQIKKSVFEQEQILQKTLAKYFLQIGYIKQCRKLKLTSINLPKTIYQNKMDNIVVKIYKHLIQVLKQFQLQVAQLSRHQLNFAMVPILNYKTLLSQQSRSTLQKLIKSIFKISSNTQNLELSKQQCLNFYKEIIMKIQSRRKFFLMNDYKKFQLFKSKNLSTLNLQSIIQSSYTEKFFYDLAQTFINLQDYGSSRVELAKSYDFLKQVTQISQFNKKFQLFLKLIFHRVKYNVHLQLKQLQQRKTSRLNLQSFILTLKKKQLKALLRKKQGNIFQKLLFQFFISFKNEDLQTSKLILKIQRQLQRLFEEDKQFGFQLFQKYNNRQRKPRQMRKKLKDKHNL